MGTYRKGKVMGSTTDINSMCLGETVVWDPDSVSSDWIESGEMFEDFSAPLPGKPSGRVFVLVDRLPKVVGSWIRVEDGLPEDGTECWVFGIYPGWDRPQVIDNARWYEGEWESESGSLLGAVTHWMRYVLPEPPSDV